MKRFWLFLILLIAALLTLAYALRVARQNSAVAVSSLLPPDTIAFVHLPDFNRTRDEWHHSDIYQLFHEPAVEEFLRTPLARFRKIDAASQTVQEIERLAPKDSFFAVTSIDARNPGFVAGFRFRGSRDAAETVVGKWRVYLAKKTSIAKHEKVAYRQHEIELAAGPTFTLATAYDGHWFFAANDVAKIKELLDRADRHADRQTALQSDKTYRTAMAHMPSDYAGLFYLQPKTIVEKLALLRTAMGQKIPPDQPAALEKIHCICGTMRFERGKIRDVLFTSIPEVATDLKLTRSSLSLGTTDTFLYLAALLDPQNLGALSQAGGLIPVTGWLQKFLLLSSNNRITTDEWKAAFDLELAAVGDWPATAHWPSIILTLPVKDFARANTVVDALTTAIDEDARWVKVEKNGVAYFSMATPATFFAVTPTIALSDRRLVAGINSASVEAAIKQSQGPAMGLANSSSYNQATRSLHDPSSFFAYIDTPLLYSRIDSALRPMLLLGAAFLPALSDRVQLDKLPPPEVVTKHLSPIVSSQRYDRDGYVVESIGPITFNQATAALILTAIYLTVARQPSH